MSKTFFQYLRAKRYPLRPATNGTLYGVNTFEPPYLAAHANVFATLVALRVQVIRLGITWSSMQTTVGGAIDWSEYDDIYALCQTHGIKLILVIETTPTAYNVQPHGYFPGSPTAPPSGLAIPVVTDPTYFPLWVSDQATWAGQVAARYPLALLEWWNEWASASGYWRENNATANKPTIAAWVTAYTAAYAAIKAANPSSQVAPGGLTGLTHWFGSNATGGVETIRQLFQVYNIQADAISIHPYTGDATSPDPSLDHYGVFGATGFANSFNDIGRVRAMMIACGKGTTPLWVSEWGNYSAAAVGSRAIQANYVTASYHSINTLHSYGAVGPNAAPVTIATYFPLIDQSFAPTDTGLVGPSGNGPYTPYASGVAYQSFMSSLPAYTPVATKVVLTAGATSVVATHITPAFVATVLDQCGIPMVVTPAFVSGTPAKATIDAVTGIASGMAAGTTNITATYGSLISNVIVLTVSAQVATSPIAVSPSSFTVALSGTEALTAVVSDQGTPAHVIAGASVSWSSGTPANITVDPVTGVATGVAGGSSTITATSGSATGTSAGTCNGSTVTSVNLFYNSVAAAPMLLFTGTTYPIVAKDQAGNVLSGVGTWSTTDGTNAPVGASTGIVAPAAGITGATITYTHTASGHTASVDVSVLVQPTWLLSELVTYANDAALRSNIRNTVTAGVNTPAPTGGAGSLYQDGVNEGSVSLDATRPFMGNQTLLMTFPASGAPPQLAALLPSTYLRLWGLTVKRYDAGFTTVGTGGGAASYKDGPFAYNASQSGRTGVVYSNTSSIYGESYLQSGSIVGGADETFIGTVGTAWTDQAWYCDMWVYEGLSNLMSERVWRFKVGAHPLSGNLVSNTAVVGPMNVGFTPMALNYFNALGMNYNQVIPSTLYKSIGFWGCVDGVTYGDPLGLLQDATSPTLSGITGGTITHGTTGATITLTGTNLTTNCYPTFSNAGVLLQSIALSGGGTTMTLTVNVTSGATPGAGTVSVTNVSSQQTSGTQVVLIL